LPRDYEELDPEKLPKELSIALYEIKAALLEDEKKETLVQDESSNL